MLKSRNGGVYINTLAAQDHVRHPVHGRQFSVESFCHIWFFHQQNTPGFPLPMSMGVRIFKVCHFWKQATDLIWKWQSKCMCLPTETNRVHNKIHVSYTLLQIFFLIRFQTLWRGQAVAIWAQDAHTPARLATLQVVSGAPPLAPMASKQQHGPHP